MLTREKVLESIRNGRGSTCADQRDFYRLALFFPEKDLEILGFQWNSAEDWTPKEWTIETVTEQLREDVAFGFEAALGKKGLSADAMHSCVLMWMWVLEDDLQHDPSYAQFGLPIFAAVARKYGFPCPIGSDRGDEREYA